LGVANAEKNKTWKIWFNISKTKIRK
jgi:hypothetical protein